VHAELVGHLLQSKRFASHKLTLPLARVNETKFG